MQVKRIEVRIMKCFVEYNIPDDLTPKQGDDLLDLLNNPDDIPYPKTFVKIDTEDSEIVSIVTISKENLNAEPLEIKDFVEFAFQPTKEQFDLDIIAEKMADDDMSEIWEETIKNTVNFKNLPFYKGKVAERKQLILSKMIKAIESLTPNN